MTVIVSRELHQGPTKTRGLWATLRDAAALARQRRTLRDLDDHLLNDIGLTRDAARSEAQKSLWAAPAHWRSRSGN